jgi:2,3-dihydroxybenzoate-AMP ligase
MLAGCAPWPEALARTYRENGYWEGRTIPETIEESVLKYAAREAIVCGEERIGYAELGRKARALARGFAGAGLKPLDRVVMQLPNGPLFIYAYLALQKIGVIPVLALAPHRHTEIAHFIGHSGAVGYIAADMFHHFDYRQMAEEMRRQYPGLGHIFIAGEPGPGQVSLDALIEAGEAGDADAAPGPREPAADEVAHMLLSGGTTALPKLIPRTHNDYVYNFKRSGALAGMGEDTVYLALLPFAHNFALGSPGIMGTLAHGGRIVISGSAQAEDVFPLIEKEKVTLVCGAVPLVINWLNAAASTRHSTASVKVFINGGARLAPELRRRIEAVFGCTYQESFGTAEGLLNQTRLDDSEALRFLSSGRPISQADEVLVVDDRGRPVADGTPGELICRGPYTIRGYYNAPEINAAAFTADGYYRTGDVVRRVDSYLYVEGRKKDLINRGGEKISCEEIENHIYALGKVKGVCVVAMPDPVFGEKGCAFVMLKPGESLCFDELKAFLLARRIAKFKLPERLEIVDAFPTSPAGKILRRELRRIVAERIAVEQAAVAAPAEQEGAVRREAGSSP